MKVVAVTQRGIAKDFVDLQALTVAYELSLDYLISQVQKKFGVSEAYSYQIKKSLVYFDDALKSLGDVTVLRDGKEAKLQKNECGRIEDFFKKFVLGL